MLYFINFLITMSFGNYPTPSDQDYHSYQLQIPSYQSSLSIHSSPHSPYSLKSQIHMSDVDLMNAKITVLNEIREAVYKGRKICVSRRECRDLDMHVFTTVRSRHQQKTYLNSFFSDFEQQLSKSYNMPAVTEWEVYNKLSDFAKKQYQSGIRINDPKLSLLENSKVGMQKRKTNYEWLPAPKNIGTAPQFNGDDLKMYILHQFEIAHLSCGGREACLQSDIRIIDNVAQLLGEDDPMKEELEQLKELIDNRKKESFNTKDFVEVYYYSLINKLPLLYKEKEKIEWSTLAKTFKTRQRRNPQILNQQELEDNFKSDKLLKNNIKKTAKQASEKAVNDLFDAVLGGRGNKDLGVFGQLFGR